MSKENELLEIISEILEEDSVGVEFELDEESWDSLAIVSYISEVDSSFDIVLSPAVVKNAKSVAELIALVG